MKLRSVFHVSPASAATTPRQELRARMPSLLDLDIEWEEEQRPRGTSIETWTRARGWSSED